MTRWIPKHWLPAKRVPWAALAPALFCSGLAVLVTGDRSALDLTVGPLNILLGLLSWAAYVADCTGTDGTATCPA